MPIYEYRCADCNRRSSALLTRFDAPDPSCPHCGHPALHRLVSTFATARSGDEGGFDADFGEDGDFAGGGDDEFGGMSDLDDDF